MLPLASSENVSCHWYVPQDELELLLLELELLDDDDETGVPQTVTGHEYQVHPLPPPLLLDDELDEELEESQSLGAPYVRLIVPPSAGCASHSPIAIE